MKGSSCSSRIGLLKTMTVIASIRCMRAMKVKVLRSQIDRPFFLKGVLLFVWLGRVNRLLRLNI